MLSTTKNLDIILNVLTLLYQLLSNLQSNKNQILCAKILKKIKHFNVLYKKDQRIFNISSLLLEDFGKRYEFIEVNTKLPLNDKVFE